MHGVTTALVSFLLVCVVFPNLVRNKAQYYSALAAVCLIILLDALGLIVAQSNGFRVVVYSMIAFLQVAALMLLFLASGGITWRELAGDMKDAYEVIRRGHEEKEIIIPLSGEFARRAGTRTSTEASEQQDNLSDPPPS